MDVIVSISQKAIPGWEWPFYTFRGMKPLCTTIPHIYKYQWLIVLFSIYLYP